MPIVSLAFKLHLGFRDESMTLEERGFGGVVFICFRISFISGNCGIFFCNCLIIDISHFRNKTILVSSKALV